MTPAERLAELERLDSVIRSRTTWTDLRALDAYVDLWEMVRGSAQQAVDVAAAARKVVETEERETLQLIGERDRAEDAADDLAAAIADLLGVPIGEHSNANDPWTNALDALSDAKCDVILPNGTHRYWSTWCRHGLHEPCGMSNHIKTWDGDGKPLEVYETPREPSRCKTCAAPCICPCHSEEASGE